MATLAVVEVRNLGHWICMKNLFALFYCTQDFPGSIEHQQSGVLRNRLGSP